MNLHNTVLILLLTTTSALAVEDEFTCGRSDVDNSPRLAVMSADKVYFYSIEFSGQSSDGKTMYLKKRSFEGIRGAYLAQGDEVVVKESPAGAAESDGQCFVYHINQEGILTSGFIEKQSLKLLPVSTKAATLDSWSDSMFFTGKSRLTYISIKKNSAHYQIAYGGDHPDGVLQFDFNIASHSLAKLHLIEQARPGKCHLILWRLNHYLYIDSEDCTERGYTFERLLRKEEK